MWIEWLLEMYQEDHRIFPLLTPHAPCPLLLLFWLLLLHFIACCKKCLHLVCGIDSKWRRFGLGGARGLWLLCRMSTEICGSRTWEGEGGEGVRVVRRWLLLFPLSSCCPLCATTVLLLHKTVLLPYHSCTKHSSCCCCLTPASAHSLSFMNSALLAPCQQGDDEW